jgi:hypothetical protein
MLKVADNLTQQPIWTNTIGGYKGFKGGMICGRVVSK